MPNAKAAATKAVKKTFFIVLIVFVEVMNLEVNKLIIEIVYNGRLQCFFIGKESFLVERA